MEIEGKAGGGYGGGGSCWLLCVVVVVVTTVLATLLVEKVEIWPAKMANFSAFITMNASLEMPQMYMDGQNFHLL